MKYSTNNDLLALVGIGLRLPGAKHPEAFWELLTKEICTVNKKSRPGLMQAEYYSLLENIDQFDADFFNIPANEAQAMDPQQRLLLEVSVEALHDAHIKPSSTKGKKIGVFVGISNADYSAITFANPSLIDAYALTGISPSICSNRIAYFFDWHGPALTIDTACSSSLTALHLARTSLLNGEANAALVAGANLILTPHVQTGYAQAAALSPEGLCRAFDAGANGVVRGEGVAAVYLKRLEDAKADGDRIYCVIAGTGVAQDGQTNGLTAPNPLGQKRAIQAALNAAGIKPHQIDYVETHGTGTLLGDPVEAKALAEVYSELRPQGQVLKIGSVKTNLGHLEAAAGLFGFIKAALCIYKKQLVASLHFANPNPYIPFTEYKLAVQTQNEAWVSDTYCAGVSSFGFGGTNVHIIALADRASPAQEKPFQSYPLKSYILPISAKNNPGLSVGLESWKQTLNQIPVSQWHHQIANGVRSYDEMNYRNAYVFRNKEELQQLLPSAVQKKRRSQPKVAFIFSGMGSQSLAMGRVLLTIHPFREAIIQCDKVLKELLNWSLYSILKGNSSMNPEDNPEVAQVLIFSIQIALFETFKCFGVKPTAVVGSSMGEVAAAYAAGYFDLKTAAHLFVTRIRLLVSRIDTGAIAVVFLSPQEASEWVVQFPKLWLAAHNAPNQVLIAGDINSIDQLLARLENEKINAKKLKGGSAPSHTPLINPIKKDFFHLLSSLTTQTPHTSFYSTVTGAKYQDSLDQEYWWKNLSGPIHYLEAISSLEKEQQPIYIELSPHPVLIANTLAIVQGAREEVELLPCLTREDTDEVTFLNCLGQLYKANSSINWEILYPPCYQDPSLALPMYPWNHHSYWKEQPKTQVAVQEQDSASYSDYPLRQTVLSLREKLKQTLWLEEYLSNKLAQALKIPQTNIQLDQSLKDLGIGSLIGMDLYNRLKNDFGVTMPIAFFLSGPSLKNIAQEVLTKLLETPTALRITKQPNQTNVLLSFGQERLLFIQQLIDKPYVYHIPIRIELTGQLNIEALKQAFAGLLARHQILRTVYQKDQGQFNAVVVPQSDFDFHHQQLDFSNEEELTRTLYECAIKPFNYANQALLRVHVFTLMTNPDRHTLILTIHHLVADGWGLKVLLHDLTLLYNHQLNQNTPPPKPLPFQFSDYAFWQKQQWQQGAWENQLNYWQERLENCPIESSFALDEPRPEQQSFNGERRVFIITQQEKKNIDAFCTAQGITPFMLLTTLVGILLYRTTGHTDIVLGTPVAGRQEPGTEQLVGCLLNMIPLRLQFEPQEPVSSLLNLVNQEVVNALAHQEIPLEKILEALEVPRRLSHSPLFQVVVAFHAPVPLQQFATLTAHLIDLDLKTAKFDVSFSFIEKEETLEGVIEYNTDLFTQTTVEHWLIVFHNVLHAILNSVTEYTIDSLPLEDPLKLEHRIQTIKKELAGKSHYCPILVTQHVSYQIAQCPDAIAISNDTDSWTYNELQQMAERCAYQLQQSSIKAHTIALCMPAGLELIAVQWASWLINACFVSIDPNLSSTQINQILTSTKADCIIYQTECPDVKIPALSWDKIKATKNKSPLLLSKIIPEDKAYLMLTSGTTGTPKVIEITHASLAHLVNWHLETYKNTSHSQCSQLAGISFDASLWEIWTALSAGSTLHIPNPEIKHDLHHLHQWIHEKQISHCFLPTPLFELCSDLDWRQSNLEYVFTGGDRLRIWPNSNWPCQVINHYGPAECTVVSSSLNLTEKKKPTATHPGIGKAIGYNVLLLLNAAQQPVPPGFIGEIYIAGPSVGLGYRTPDKNHSFIPNLFGSGILYKTGDFARQDKYGFFEFLGRRDQQIKINGVRIELAEIELIISTLPYIQQVELLVLEEKQLACFITLKEHPGTPPITEIPNHVKAAIKQQLGPYKVPGLIQVLEKMPVTANGKIDRKRLALQTCPIEKSVIDPNNTIVNRLLTLLKTVLKNEKITPDSHFFAYGGNSILAMQFIALIQQHFHIELSVKELFANPNLHQMAQIIEARQKTRIPALIPDPEQHYVPFPLTDIQQAYWIGRRSDLAGGGVSAQIYLEIDAHTLDIKYLQQAVNGLIARHAMLRTLINDEGLQYTLEKVPGYVIETHDLSQSPNWLLEQRNHLSHHYFNANQWPLFRLSISTDYQQFYRIHFNIDGLIADAHSLKILLDDLWNLYQGKSLIPLSLSFRDYLIYTITQLPPKEESKQYWLKRLSYIAQAPQLPLLNKVVSQPVFKRKSKIVPANIWGALKEQAKNHHLSPSTVLLTAFSTVLARWSEHPEFTLMLTVFNRRMVHPEVSSIVGDFTTVLPFSTSVSYHQPFIQYAKEIQDTVLDNLEHSDVGGIWILRELHKQGKGPFPVVFTSFLSEDFDTQATPFGTIAYSLTQTPQVWLDHQVSEYQGELHFNWDYNAPLFAKKTIEDLFLAYCDLLERLAENAALWEREKLDIGHPKLRQSLQQATHLTPVPASNMDLYSLFERHEHDDAEALITPTQSITYKKLHDLVKQGRTVLQHYGIQIGDKVALCLPKSIEQIAAVLAILAEGACFVPLGLNQPNHRMDHILKQAQARFLLVHEEHALQEKLITIYWTKELSQAQPCTTPRASSNPKSLAYIIFTSGSTGMPKGVQIQHQAVVPTLLAVNELVKLNTKDTILYSADLSFDLAIYDIFGAFLAKARTAIPEAIENKNIDELASFARRASVSIWNSVPTLFHMYFGLATKQKQYEIPSLRCVLLSGDWLCVKMCQQVRSQLPYVRLISLGGATEASIWSIYYPIDKVDPHWQSIPYGTALPGQQVLVYNNQMELCPPLVSGNLYIAGVGLSLGYTNDPTMNSKKFIEHQGIRLYDTGDRGRYLPDFSVEFLGRRDNQVKIQGYRIELGEIEHQLKMSPAIKEAIVLASGKPREEKTLVAYIECYDVQQNLEELNLAEYLTHYLPFYMIPRCFIKQEYWPLNSNGKIDRKQLPEPQTTSIIKQPIKETAVKEQLRTIIQSILKINDLEDEKEFLTLGANSIDLVLISNRLQEQFGFSPGMSEMFRLKNLELLTQYYQEHQGRNKTIHRSLLAGKEREQFKLSKKWIRALVGEQITLHPEGAVHPIKTQSSRQFAGKPLSKQQLTQLLAILSQSQQGQEFKAHYPSAGSLFPVQTYLMIKKNSVEDIDQGVYYFHPLENQLIKLNTQTARADQVHLAMNIPIGEQSCCSLFFFNSLDAIEPLYAESSLQYGLIEAGAMTQLLRMHASTLKIGICSIGQVNIDLIKTLAQLNSRYQFLHALEVGTLITEEQSEAWEELTF